MLIINTKTLRTEQNKLLKAFNNVIEAVKELGITGKDNEDIQAILGKHFEKQLEKLVDKHKALPEEVEKEKDKEEKQEADNNSASNNLPINATPTNAITNGIPQAATMPTGDDEDAF